MIKITLPDNSVREYEKGIKALEVAKSISEGLARNVVGAVYNGDTIGLQNILNEDGNIKFLKFEDKEGKDVFWHTSSHIMAHAIKRLWPDAKLAIGPAIDNGFYYDIDLEHRFVQEDLEKIEAEMRRVIPVMKESGGYIFASDHSIPNTVSFDNFRKIIELVRELGSYR